ncbi:MAG: hypothetical protein R3C28_29310 [Pirellulaceae bacterium]
MTTESDLKDLSGSTADAETLFVELHEMAFGGVHGLSDLNCVVGAELFALKQNGSEATAFMKTKHGQMKRVSFQRESRGWAITLDPLSPPNLESFDYFSDAVDTTSSIRKKYRGHQFATARYDMSLRLPAITVQPKKVFVKSWLTDLRCENEPALSVFA